MTYTEIKQKGNKKYYYRGKSIRHGKKVDKQRIYLGVNLNKKELQKKEEQADKKLLNIQETKQPIENRKQRIKQNSKQSDTFDKDTKGITKEKDEFSEWFTQIMLKADLADYTDVSGCIIFKPAAYAIWENITQEINKRFKKAGIRNAYFPLFIPEKLLNKEQEHVKGFAPEVAWVTHAGKSKLNERLAIRPTSETIMYPSYAKWIRSWRDLPLKLNLWNSVVRWEFKHPIPFLRTREFLWQEGHTAFASKKEAQSEKETIIGIYNDVCRNYLALPSLIGRKTEKEKFAGAEYTISMEFYMPNGKAVQGPDFHHDGQKFAKAYDVKFLDKNEKEEYVWQNTFGFSTRMLGVMFAVHSDRRGLIIPPKIAEKKIVIIPILFEKTKQKIIKKTEQLKKHLSKFNPILDNREEYSPGFKFNEYELKGIPIRIEIGPKDLEKKQATLVRRDIGEKILVPEKQLEKEIAKILEDIQNNLLKKAERLLKSVVVKVKNLNELQNAIKNKKIALVSMCKELKCEDMLKYKTNGAKILNIPKKQPRDKGRCIICNKKADYIARIARSY